MKQEFVLEFKRQMAHLLLGLSIAFAVYFLYPLYGNLILVPLIIGVALMIIVPRIVSDLKIANHLLYHFEREHDIVNFPFRGAIFYGIGIIFPILFLPLNMACAAIAVLSAGDSISTLIGKPHGRYRIGHKSLEGSLAFLMAGFLAASFFIPDNLLLAFIFAFIGSIVELFIDIADDNLLIPITLTASYQILHMISSNPILLGI